MRKFLLALAVVALATPAFAAVQNVKVSGDIDNWMVSRDNFNLGSKIRTGVGTGTNQGLKSQNVFLTQTRIRVDADLSDNVSTTVRLLSENAWGAGNINSGIGIDLAYATLREFLYSPLTVTVGRQEFIYGNGMILGGNGPNNGTTGSLQYIAADRSKNASNDGVKLVFDYKPLTLDVLYIKAGQTTLTGAELANRTSTDVYGLNANYQLGDSNNSAVEGYLFSRLKGSNVSTATDKGDSLYVPGLRVSTNPIKGLTTSAEVAWQLGYVPVSAGGVENAVHRNAMAYQLMGSYAIQGDDLAKYKPSVNASYSHFSGDKNAAANHSSDAVNSAKRYSAWDSFMEGQNGGTIYNALFTLSNLNILTAGATVSPIEDVTASFLWSNLSADKKYRTGNALSITQPDGSSTNTIVTSGRKDVGNEYDVNVNYAYTEDVTLGLSLGWFAPGKAFDGVNDSTASQALAHVNVNF